MNALELMASLRLDDRGYYMALDKADARAKGFASNVNKRIDGVRRGFRIGALAMGAAITAFGVKSIKTTAQFDKSMSQVAATMGYTTEDLNDKTSDASKNMEKLRGFAKKMGATTKFSARESADALNYMALAGYDAEESMKMLPNVLNLAAAGDMDLATASDMVTDAQTALGLSMDETTEMVDKMARASSKSNTSVSQLGQAILTVGGTAKSLKGGTTELSTTLGLLADNGIKGAKGGTALRNVLTSFAQGKFDKNFKKLGVSAYDSEGNLRSLKDVFLDMNKAMDGMSEQEKQQLIAKTFNKADLKSVNALLGTSAERWDELTAEIEKSDGAAGEMAKTQLDNLAGDVTILKSAFEGLQISVGEKLTPIVRKFVQGLTKMIEYADILGPIILGLATSFGILAVAVNFEKMITGFAALKMAITAVVSPVGIVVAVLAGIAVALVLLWKNSERFRKAVTKAFGDVVKKGQEVWASLQPSLKSLWESLKQIGTVVIYVAGIVGKILIVVLQRLAPIILGIVAVTVKVVAAIVNFVARVLTAFTKLGELKAKVAEIFGAVKTAIGNKLSDAKNAVRAAVSGIAANMINRFKSARKSVLSTFDGIKNGIKSKINAAKDAVKRVVDKIKGFFPFKLGKLFSFSVPKVDIGSKTQSVGKKKATAPTFDVSYTNFAKAMNEPYMFGGGLTLFGAGEAGDEVLYGHKSLMEDIREASAEAPSGVTQYNYVTVNGAENPEDFARRFIKEMKIQARTA